MMNQAVLIHSETSHELLPEKLACASKNRVNSFQLVNYIYDEIQ